MRILIISPVPTHPANRGNTVRILRMSEEMRGLGHDVWFLHTSFQEGDKLAMKAHWKGRVTHHAYQKPWRRYRFGGLPVPDRWHHLLLKGGWLHQRVDQFYDQSLDSVIQSLQARHAFDAVVVEYVSFSRALKQFGKGVLKLIDTHDIYTGRHKRLLKAGVYPEWFFLSRREERKGLMRADRVIAIQDVERDFFCELLHGRRIVKTVGHFLPVASPSLQGDGRRLMFLGANATLNERSLSAFLEEVWPRIHSADGRIELHVYGTITEIIGTSPPNVRVHRELDDVAEAYRSADIVINPMLAGTGLKIKTIEALAHGCPVVASPAAVEGLPLFDKTSEYPWLLASSRAQWSDQILDLSNNGELRRELSRRALEYGAIYMRVQRENLKAVLEPIA